MLVGRSWDGPKYVEVWFTDGAKSIVVRYSFKPIFEVFALSLSSSATSVFRQMPVIPGLGIIFHFLFVDLFALPVLKPGGCGLLSGVAGLEKTSECKPPLRLWVILSFGATSP